TAGELPRSVTMSATPPISKSQSAPSMVLTSPSSPACLSQLLSPSVCFMIASRYLFKSFQSFKQFKTFRNLLRANFLHSNGLNNWNALNGLNKIHFLRFDLLSSPLNSKLFLRLAQ